MKKDLWAITLNIKADTTQEAQQNLDSRLSKIIQYLQTSLGCNQWDAHYLDAYGERGENLSRLIELVNSTDLPKVKLSTEQVLDLLSEKGTIDLELESVTTNNFPVQISVLDGYYIDLHSIQALEIPDEVLGSYSKLDPALFQSVEILTPTN